MSASVSSTSVIEKEPASPKVAGTGELELTEMPLLLRESIGQYGGLAALLLQIAHPGVGRGVHDHSEFATRQLDRGEKTAVYVYTMVYGTDEEKSLVRQWVNRAHARVKGGSGDDKYNANDPHLQLWVAATLYASMSAMYERMWGEFPPERAERIYQEYSVYATSLRVPMELWPKDRAAFWEYYWGVVNNDLVVVSEAKEIFYHIMHPKVPFYLRPLVAMLLPINRSFAIDLLPAKVSAGFGLKTETGRGDRLLQRVVLSLYNVTPPFIRYYPKTYYMGRAKTMVKMIKEQGFANLRMRAG
ncbi:hypothetical protein FE257_001808 [Aspergillus nanangensis]|uniref:ER-bound oxygenase mpaB/mpaB'/Rubber oxygenase catalytic domain-containing protein n=1 Tax=Aspergillus nanangensis TaxID=2582783 RepID=A0AAD4CDS6_ASPNN|nr:hypothetical protein FE257_001808 [Aspergillus nanangensis]